MKKDARVNIKITPKEKQRLMDEANHLGFMKGKGVPNFSRFCRWILREGNRPIDRKSYKELSDVSIHLMKLGSLFNQNQFHSNRELKILNDGDYSNKSNQGVIKRLEHNIELSEGIKKEILEIRKIVDKITIIENS